MFFCLTKHHSLYKQENGILFLFILVLFEVILVKAKSFGLRPNVLVKKLYKACNYAHFQCCDIFMTNLL